MVITKQEMKVEEVQHLRGGDGSIIKEILAPADPSVHIRLFVKFTLKKGCGIGPHDHSGEIEYFYILSGEGVFNDNGVEKTVHAGDMLMTGWGETHSFRNEKDEDLVFIAVIPTEK